MLQLAGFTIQDQSHTELEKNNDLLFRVIPVMLCTIMLLLLLMLILCVVCRHCHDYCPVLVTGQWSSMLSTSMRHGIAISWLLLLLSVSTTIVRIVVHCYCAGAVHTGSTTTTSQTHPGFFGVETNLRSGNESLKTKITLLMIFGSQVNANF